MAMAQLFPADDREAPAARPRPGVRPTCGRGCGSGCRSTNSRKRSSSAPSRRVIASQRQLLEESKHEAIRALSEGFADKMARLQRQLTEKDVTVSNIARYFEEVVADLTDKSHRDPEDEAPELRLVHGAGRVVPRGRAARPLVRRRRRRHQQLQVVQRHARPRGRRPDHRARRAHPVGSDPVGGLSRARARRRCARSARAVRRRRILLPDSRSARVRRGGGHRRSLQGRGRRARLEPRTIAGWRAGRSASTSASSACGSVRCPSAAASRASSPPN